MSSGSPVAQQLPYYRPVGRELEVFEHAYSNRLPLLLKGPTGTGKSRLVEFMASSLGRPLISVACHEETSAVDPYQDRQGRCVRGAMRAVNVEE